MVAAQRNACMTRVKWAGCKQCLPNVAPQSHGLPKNICQTTKDNPQTPCRSFCQAVARLFEAFQFRSPARRLTHFSRRPSKNGRARTATRGAGGSPTHFMDISSNRTCLRASLVWMGRSLPVTSGFPLFSKSLSRCIASGISGLNQWK